MSHSLLSFSVWLPRSAARWRHHMFVAPNQPMETQQSQWTIFEFFSPSRKQHLLNIWKLLPLFSVSPVHLGVSQSHSIIKTADHWLRDLWNLIPRSGMLLLAGLAGWGGVSRFEIRDKDKATAAGWDELCLGVKVEDSCGGTQPLIVFTFSFSVTFANPQTASPHNILPVYPPHRHRRRRHSLLLITYHFLHLHPLPLYFPSLPSPPPLCLLALHQQLLFIFMRHLLLPADLPADVPLIWQRELPPGTPPRIPSPKFRKWRRAFLRRNWSMERQLGVFFFFGCRWQSLKCQMSRLPF